MADYDDDEDEGPESPAEEAAEQDGKKYKSSKSWLEAIDQAEKAFSDYQSKADNVDKAYADLSNLAQIDRERQFQLFWANIQVIGPSIYARPPIPVVVPAFKERRPLPRTAAEVLERCTIAAFKKCSTDASGIDTTMLHLRDDLTILARGVAWLRYEAQGENGALVEKVVVEHTDRKDFLHEPARKWEEVDWVAKRSHLARKAMRKRFKKTSGDTYKTAAYAVLKEDKDAGAANAKLKAGVWEVWCKSENRVYWVTEGVDVCLDEGPPHLKIDGFFPCPKPAYSTVQRRTLIPVPDMTFYKDQLEEINELTARISALSEAVRVRGFYPAGAGEIGDAIETALKSTSNNQVMVPISNWAAFGNSGAKDMIVWLPIEIIAEVIAKLVELRKQLIDDVYQITGISDIMRGQTEASETLGAQKLKSQYGSIRIKDRQAELVRISLDITRIAAEIMAENFQPQTLLEMSQMELPTDADIKAQIGQLTQQAAQIRAQAQQQIQQATSDPQTMQAAQSNPGQAQQAAQQIEQQVNQQLEQLKGQAQKLQQTVTIDQVVRLLREQRLRPFVLDIETDSTISPDEDAQKQRATEFITAVGGFLNQAIQAVETLPQTAPLMADALKYVASQFRAGRELDQSIDEFADQMKQMAAQPKPPSPEQMKAQAESQHLQAKAAVDQASAQEKTANAQKTVLEAQSKAKQDEQDRAIAAQEAMDAAEQRRTELEGKQAIVALQIDQMHAKRLDEIEKHSQEMDKGALEIALLTKKIEQSVVQTENAVKTTEANVNATADKTEIAKDAAKHKQKEPA
jgi:hypothetical protein